MATTQTILITGATGNQGGAVARELLGRGFTIRALTRKPDGDAAQALAKQGAQIVQGDLNDASSLQRALDGVWGVWAVQNTWEAGVELEEQQGKQLARMARDQGVQHYVYTSVGSAHRQTGIPHFDNKARIEEAVRGLAFPSHVILRPVFFMENLLGPGFVVGDKLMAAMSPDKPLHMIAVEDIGKYGRMAFERAAELNGAAIDLAGDAVTMPQVAATLGRAMGKPLQFVQLPLEEVRKHSEDFAVMFDWFDRIGYDVDIGANQRRFGIQPTTLAEWAAKAAKR